MTRTGGEGAGAQPPRPLRVPPASGYLRPIAEHSDANFDVQIWETL